MNIAKNILIGVVYIVLSGNISGQDSFVDITSNSRDGYQDVTLNIVDTQLVDDVWNIIAKGRYNDSIVGFKIKIKNGLDPGLVKGRMDNTTWARGAVEMSGIGRESDNFVRVLSELYGIKTEKMFTDKPIVFTCFSLNSKQAFLKQGRYKFKLYFDDNHESGVYTEIFLITDFPNGYIELPDLDPQFNGDFVKAMIR